MPMRRVLLTGTAGYIGSTLTRHLLERSYRVWGMDVLMYGDVGIRGFKQDPNYKFFQEDIRDPHAYDSVIQEVDAIIHLAAIVGMPVCAKRPDLANETNWVATKDLFDLANRTRNIKRFIFASSTSVYGAVKGNGFVNEGSSSDPLSVYADTKARCEDYILNSPRRSGFVPTVLRFPTAYGLSRRMRFDLTVNEFTRDLTLGRELKIFGEQFWRPYCHVEDLARACVWALQADDHLVNREIYCVGDTKENYTKRMIYDALVELIPEGKISLIEKIEDARDYRVDFSKIERAGFEITKTVKDGIREIYRVLKKGEISNPFDPIHTSVL
ncbi:MAG: SDR family oxidoreductase [Chloroflexi bacterium]|nr:SDR family oxidoreductase [Chloroflexota bacterium]